MPTMRLLKCRHVSCQRGAFLETFSVMSGGRRKQCCKSRSTTGQNTCSYQTATVLFFTLSSWHFRKRWIPRAYTQKNCSTISNNLNNLIVGVEAIKRSTREPSCQHCLEVIHECIHYMCVCVEVWVCIYKCIQCICPRVVFWWRQKWSKDERCTKHGCVTTNETPKTTQPQNKDENHKTGREGRWTSNKKVNATKDLGGAQ